MDAVCYLLSVVAYRLSLIVYRRRSWISNFARQGRYRYHVKSVLVSGV